METSPYRPTPHEASFRAEDPRVAQAKLLVDQSLDRLIEGVSETIDSEPFKQFLETMGQFHHYSVNNQLLIHMQKPDATRCAGFNRWKKLGRWVKQGESGIKIFAPMIHKGIDPSTGEETETLTGYKIVNTFDVSQTDGKPLPEPPRVTELKESTEAGRLLYGYTSDWLADQGIPVFRLPVPGMPKARGAFMPGEHKKIYVAPDLADDMAAKTLIHESAHYVADHRGWDAKEDVESVAEGTAFVVSSRYGIDTSDYSFGYIARWAEDKDVFKRNLDHIRVASHQIISGIEGKHVI